MRKDILTGEQIGMFNRLGVSISSTIESATPQDSESARIAVARMERERIARLLHVAQKSNEKVEEKIWVSPLLGFTESTIVLGSVVVLFIAFVIVQFQYFFGGQANISIEGYTYSRIGRRLAEKNGVAGWFTTGS